MRHAFSTWRFRHRGDRSLVTGCLLALTLLVGKAAAQDTDTLLNMSLDELTSIEVTTVSRRAEPLQQASAAVFVITAEDIRRAGVRTIPEALRLAPGMHVARLDSSRWAVSARGFMLQYANKLLVMVDGRTVYSPLFSGVFWDAQDLVLADIDRIEVIRGPGASLWGPNAVNGVINIITQHSQDTQGTHVTFGAGNEERGFASLRYGGRLNAATTYRVHAKGTNRDGSIITDSGEAGPDTWRQARAGLRLDYEGSGRTAFTLQGDAYKTQAGNALTYVQLSPPAHVQAEAIGSARGLYLQGEWRQRLAPRAQFKLRGYVEALKRDESYLDFRRRTANLDAQQTLPVGRYANLLLGLTLRRHWLDLPTSVESISSTAPSTLDLYAGFAQTNIELIPNHLNITLGGKWSKRSLSNGYFMPTARLRLTPSPKHTLWASFSRGARLPSLLERNLTLTLPEDLNHEPPTLMQILPSPDFTAEKLHAYELGWRWQASPHWHADLALFFHDYDDLVGAGPGKLLCQPSGTAVNQVSDCGEPAALLVRERPTQNEAEAQSRGLELGLNWQPKHSLYSKLAYTYMVHYMHRPTRDFYVYKQDYGHPQHQLNGRVGGDAGQHYRWEIGLRYVDDIGRADFVRIPAYWSAHARLAWRPRPGLELALVGQDLLDARHLEYQPEFTTELPAQSLQRRVYVSLTADF